MTLGEYLVILVVCIGISVYLLDRFSRRDYQNSYMHKVAADVSSSVDDPIHYDTDSVAWSIFHELLDKTEAGKIKWDYIYPDKLSENKSIYKCRIYSAVKNRVKIVVDGADITLDGTVMCNAWDVPNFDKLRNAICTYCDREDERKVTADEARIYNKFKGKKK